MDFSDAVFIAAGILGALLLSLMGRQHVRLPAATAHRLEHADEWLDTPASGTGVSNLESALRESMTHARAGASLGERLRARVHEDDELASFLEEYAERSSALADDAAEILERRFISGELRDEGPTQPHV